jgi:preprotein translocase subunit SecA
MRELERRIVLSVLDRKWREHLYEMDYLQEGISLRGYGQRDPLVEYQREAFDMFAAMMDAISEESVGFLFNVEVDLDEAQTDDAQTDDAAGQAEVPVAAIDEPPAATEAPAALVEPAAAPAPMVSDAPSGGTAPAAAAPAAPTEHRDVSRIVGDALGQPRRPSSLEYSAPTVDGESTVTHSSGHGPESAGTSFANASRNAPCPCGSGKKFKKCHGAPAASA